MSFLQFYSVAHILIQESPPPLFLHNLTLFVCVFTQQAPERGGQSDAMYEVVSLQREMERSNEEKGRLASPTEEEEADEGTEVSLFRSLFGSFGFKYSLGHSNAVWDVFISPSVNDGVL